MPGSETGHFAASCPTRTRSGITGSLPVSSYALPSQCAARRGLSACRRIEYLHSFPGCIPTPACYAMFGPDMDMLFPGREDSVHWRRVGCKRYGHQGSKSFHTAYAMPRTDTAFGAVKFAWFYNNALGRVAYPC
eukprot:1477142-Rhodomonas_salina.2